MTELIYALIGLAGGGIGSVLTYEELNRMEIRIL